MKKGMAKKTGLFMADCFDQSEFKTHMNIQKVYSVNLLYIRSNQAIVTQL
jgi:hypothetical protein